MVNPTSFNSFNSIKFRINYYQRPITFLILVKFRFICFSGQFLLTVQKKLGSRRFSDTVLFRVFIF